MLPSLRSHDEYIEFVTEQMASVTVPKVHQGVQSQLALLDLTPIRVLMLDLYCPTHGRVGFAPEDLLRTYLAMILCSVTSPSQWVRHYLSDSSGFYATVSGFTPQQVPSVGCLYLFIARLMQLPQFCRTKQIRRKAKRLSRGEKKRLKDDKKKVTKRHAGIVARLTKRFMRQADVEQQVYVPHQEAIVNAILQCRCVGESQRRGLLDKNHLNLAGDSTKLPVHGNRYGLKVCNCTTRECECKRYYNAKDAAIGYDSYRDAYVYGHSLYQLTSWSRNHTAELPVYLMMTQANRHDSVTACGERRRRAISASFVMNRATQCFSVDTACFDAAHDATGFYQMAAQLWQTQLRIPLNTTNAGNFTQIPMASVVDGIPICAQGHAMYFSGYCADRDRVKFRCPIKATKAGQELGETCQCSTSSYGRVVYTHPKTNLRLYPSLPRSSDTFKADYKHRTSAERVFKRQKLDLLLAGVKTRCKGRHLFFAMLTAIAVHLLVWHQRDTQDAAKQ